LAVTDESVTLGEGLTGSFVWSLKGAETVLEVAAVAMEAIL
jgi:hypothetical protein